MSKSQKETLSLADFMRAKRRAECPVCQLPEEVTEQLAEAGRKKISRRDQIEWLNNELGIDISSADLDKHYSGRHNAA